VKGSVAQISIFKVVRFWGSRKISWRRPCSD